MDTVIIATEDPTTESMMIYCHSLENKGVACPAQWEGTDVNGLPVYIRYRGGKFTIDHAGVNVFKTRIDRTPIDAPMSDVELFKNMPWFVSLDLATIDRVIAALREEIRQGLDQDEQSMLLFDEVIGTMDALTAEAEVDSEE
jgi:hypothetical protein